jgi:hypothetical protein
MPRVGFIVTNLARPAERIVAFYNQRGTAEQWITMSSTIILGGRRCQPTVRSSPS